MAVFERDGRVATRIAGAGRQRLLYTRRMGRPIIDERLRPALDNAVERLRAIAPVERVILFGSRAHGDHDADSDGDLCVLLNEDIPPGVYTLVSMWRAVRGLGLAIQVIPMRRSVFESRLADINALAHDVAQDGVVIFDAAARPQ